MKKSLESVTSRFKEVLVYYVTVKQAKQAIVSKDGLASFLLHLKKKKGHSTH